MRNLLIIGAGLLLLSAPAYCQIFGIPGTPTIVWDPKNLAQLEQDAKAFAKMVELYGTANAIARNIEAAVKTGNYPAALAGMITAGAFAVETAGQSDPVRYAKMQKDLQLARIALQESQLSMGGRPSAGNIMLATQLAIQAEQLQERTDDLNKKMQYQAAMQSKLAKVPDTINADAGAGGWVPQ